VVKEKSNLWLPVALMGVLALTRFPGLLPENFSAVYALAFCAGVFFPSRMAWWLPLGTLLATDLLLNLYYQYYLKIDTFSPKNLVFLSSCYLAYVALIWLGKRFTARASWLALLGGGLLGALLFYFITNTASWLQNPEYPKTLAGWIQALTVGIPGWPPTWTFFRNTLLSGGLFTGLFVGAMKLAETSAEQEAEETQPEEEAAPEAEPEEGKA
jgi:hypothetical protein